MMLFMAQAAVTFAWLDIIGDMVRTEVSRIRDVAGGLHSCGAGARLTPTTSGTGLPHYAGSEELKIADEAISRPAHKKGVI